MAAGTTSAARRRTYGAIVVGTRHSMKTVRNQLYYIPHSISLDFPWKIANAPTAQCTHYLCPGTLSCVHFPHHCPCAWDSVEDKVELGDGIAVCGSKGGWSEGEFAKKVALARKGLL